MKLIPNVSAISRELHTLLTSEEGSKTAQSFLATLYFSLWDFDEPWYLSNNPDLNAAIPSSDFPTGWHHFRAVGYFEGRMPIAPYVDDNWYLGAYPDVSSAVINGIFANALDHFVRNGYAEGRLPTNPGVQPGWYAPRFMHGLTSATTDIKLCTEHFLRIGYLNGAFPARYGTK